MHDDHPAIEIQALVKRFGDFTAVDQLSLRVSRGQLFGFLGPNGAGKTTTLKMLTGLMQPSAGRARVAGHDVVAEPLQVKSRIGVVPESLGLYERLSPREHLELTGRLHGLDAGTIARRSGRLLEHLGLTERADSLVVDFSTGMKKKTALAAALLPGPEVLFLDEPFEGVDVVSSRVIKDMLRALVDQRGVTVFFSTHIMELVERLCDEVAVIHQGRLIAQGDLADLRRATETGAEASLEEVFLSLVDARPTGVDRLDWLDTP
ncbi:MAG: ABC transporter ATP-binding protein [Chloroflexi bacterium]|nr:ABC transporter ATP-binding protein [Chloroflexota bacterium]